MKQQLSYTGKLFRRIAIDCGAWTGKPHKVWYIHLKSKHYRDYDSSYELIWSRGEDGKWHSSKRPEDDKEYEFWKALRWLKENGYIDLSEEAHACRNTYGYVSFTITDTAIRLTEKGLAAAPAYMKVKED